MTLRVHTQALIIAVHFWIPSGQTFASRLPWPIYRLVSGRDWVETKM